MADVRTLEKMLADGRDSALLRFGLGKLYIDHTDFLQAVRHLEACLAIDGSYSAAWKLLGKARFGLNDLTGAGEAWRSGIETARRNGDKQTEKEMSVFLRRLEKS